MLESRKARYGISVTRMLMGLSALGLLLSNFSTRLYSFASGSVWNGEVVEANSDFAKTWIFSAFHHAITNDAVFTVLYLLLMVLAVIVVIGWRTRIVMPVFWVMWISFIESNDMLGDQGDNMFRIAMLIMLFMDTSSRWSLDARRRARRAERPADAPITQITNLVHNFGLVALTAQVSFVYASGGLYKAGGSPWSGGYAVYNPLQTERFGTWPILSDFVTSWGPGVAIISWGSIILQIAFLFMLLTRPTRVIGLLGILSFHIGIGVLMGLPWFSLTMIAIDSIFIRDRTWSAMATGLKEMGQQAAHPEAEPARATAQAAAEPAAESGSATVPQPVGDRA
nr:HTTM domain-containing protein [Leucobacter exalbidus]